MNPSEEQQHVIDSIKMGYNVKVDAVAGSGKTTTVLCLADQLSDKIIIQLTYNAELKEEVATKKEKYSQDMCLDGLSIYTYHGLATKFYTEQAKRDIGINQIVFTDMSTRKKLPPVNILVIDEIQDMNLLYYKFVCKFICDLKRDIQLLVLGDSYQGLYEFKGADTRFLTYASSLWDKHSSFPFKELKLSTSYRVTNPISDFVNQVMLGYPRIQAQKYGHNVLFIRHTNQFDTARIIAHRILDQLRNGLKPDDIFILAASVKSPNSPLKIVENILVAQGYPCYTPMNETASIKSSVIKNKIIFASFHQSKGRERKLVIVYGFDNSYFQYYNRDANPAICPSTLYVAATRATETLILIESGDPLPFLKLTHNQISTSDHTTFIGVPLGIMNNPTASAIPPTNQIKTSPTDLIKFMNESLIVNLSNRVEALFKVDPKSYPVNIVNLKGDVETTYGTHLLCEEVFDINGLAIPAMFEESHSTNKMSEIKRYVQSFYERSLVKNTDHFLVNKIKTIDFDNMTTSDYLKMTNIYISLQEKLHCKVAQIGYYNWLSDQEVDRIMENMNRHIEAPKDLIYEKTIIDYEDKTYKRMDEFVKQYSDFPLRFNARVDAITDTTVWEFKCVDSLEIEHLLQVIIYAWIWRVTHHEDDTRVFKIMNIRTAEVRILTNIPAEIDNIVSQIIESKYKKQMEIRDVEFIDRTKSLF
jgi:hypothetical protein